MNTTRLNALIASIILLTLGFVLGFLMRGGSDAIALNATHNQPAALGDGATIENARTPSDIRRRESKDEGSAPTGENDTPVVESQGLPASSPDVAAAVEAVDKAIADFLAQDTSGRITGLVLREDGSPVPGIEITLYLIDAPPGLEEFLTTANGHAKANWYFRACASTTSDAAGAFAFEGLNTSARYYLGSLKHDVRPERASSGSIHDLCPSTHVLLRYEESYPIFYFKLMNRPEADISIVILRHFNDGNSHSTTIALPDDGLFELQYPKGKRIVTLPSQWSAVIPEDIDLSANSRENPVCLTLEPTQEINIEVDAAVLGFAAVRVGRLRFGDSIYSMDFVPTQGCASVAKVLISEQESLNQSATLEFGFDHEFLFCEREIQLTDTNQTVRIVLLEEDIPFVWHLKLTDQHGKILRLEDSVMNVFDGENYCVGGWYARRAITPYGVVVAPCSYENIPDSAIPGKTRLVANFQGMSSPFELELPSERRIFEKIIQVGSSLCVEVNGAGESNWDKLQIQIGRDGEGSPSKVGVQPVAGNPQMRTTSPLAVGRYHVVLRVLHEQCGWIPCAEQWIVIDEHSSILRFDLPRLATLTVICLLAEVGSFLNVNDEAFVRCETPGVFRVENFPAAVRSIEFRRGYGNKDSQHFTPGLGATITLRD